MENAARIILRRITERNGVTIADLYLNGSTSPDVRCTYPGKDYVGSCQRIAEYFGIELIKAGSPDYVVLNQAVGDSLYVVDEPVKMTQRAVQAFESRLRKTLRRKT